MVYLCFRSFPRFQCFASNVLFLAMLRPDRSKLIVAAVDSEDNYKQLHFASDSSRSSVDWTSCRCLFNNRFQFYLLLLLILTCQSESLPLHSQGKSLPFPRSILFSNLRSPGRSQPSSTSSTVISLSKDFSRQWANAPGSSISDLSQQNPSQSSSSSSFNPFRRERHRRVMIDRLLILFDEDGARPCPQ